VIKPLVWRSERLPTDFGDGKVLMAKTMSELRAALDHVAHSYERVLVQRFIAGDETRVESYHGYVDPRGETAAEFTGRKVRTSPAHFGQSTAVSTTDEPDVIELGRRVVREVGLQGVAKVDFKRDTDGRLWLFEVNARFNLWHRVGATAGCNIPALVFDDLTGRPRVPYSRGRPGVTWCRQPRDALEAWRQGVPLPGYFRWLLRCDAVAGLRLSDPMPFLRGSVPIHLRGGVQRVKTLRRRGA
jgi:D-aspartate ligase